MKKLYFSLLVVLSAIAIVLAIIYIPSLLKDGYGDKFAYVVSPVVIGISLGTIIILDIICGRLIMVYQPAKRRDEDEDDIYVYGNAA